MIISAGTARQIFGYRMVVLAHDGLQIDIRIIRMQLFGVHSTRMSFILTINYENFNFEQCVFSTQPRGSFGKFPSLSVGY
jgi:hypothetical protein